VRLAVARFQPESVSLLELSPIVTTDMVPLLADRTLTVRRDSPPGNRSAGPGEGRTEGESGRPTPRRPPRVPTTRVLRDPTYNVTLSGLDQGLSGVGNRVDVCVEEFVGPDMLAGVVDVTGLGSLVDAAPAWRAIHRQSGLLNQPIVVPQPNTSGAYRLRVREVEPIATSDPEAAEKGGPDAEMSERTVFLDVVPIFGPPAGKFPPDGHIDGPETDPFPVDT
jgi:hypothetical protein